MAAALCRKLIRLSPNVVRAHCTLAFLSARDHKIGDAEQALRDYVRATQHSRTQRFAIPRLRLMADATTDASVRRLIAHALRDLADAEGYECVLASGTERPALPRGGRDEQAQWDRLLRAALMDPQELWERCWINYNSFRGTGEEDAGTELYRVLDSHAATEPPPAAVPTVQTDAWSKAP